MWYNQFHHFLSSLLHLLFCNLSDLSARPPSLSIVLRSDEIGLRRASGALCFINSTSPLKDRPLTKLLFKGKKIHTCVGVEVCWVCVCVRACACTYTYMHTCASMAIQEMIHPTPGLADNFTVSWSRSLCASHFLWGTVTAATAALYSSGGEKQWKTHNGCIVAVSKISSMNQQQKSNNQAYFHIINCLFVSHCTFHLVHIVCIIKKMTKNFETKSLNITYIDQKLIRCYPSTSLDHKILLIIEVFKVEISLCCLVGVH